MANLPTSLFALPVEIPDGVTLSVTVGGGPASTIALTSGSSKWCRMLLARAYPTAAGTLADPYEILAWINARIAALVISASYSLGTDGFVRLTNNEASAVTITTTPSSWVLDNLLGVYGMGAVPAGTTAKATRQPGWCVFTVSRDNDSDWQSQTPNLASADLADGTVVGYTDGRALLSRTMDWTFLPRDFDVQTTAADSSTPALPRDTPAERAWLTTPALDVTAQAIPWTAHQHVVASVGKPMGFVLGTLQDAIAGGSGGGKVYRVGYLQTDTLREQQRRPAVPGSERWQTFGQMALTASGSGTT